MWTPATRRRHGRAGLHYRSDLTEEERAILAPFLPALAGCGQRRAYAMRKIVNAISDVLGGGIARRLMPDSFPPWSTVYRWLARLRDEGTWETINHHLVMCDHERVGREASPTATMVDTNGRALKLQTHAADIQDCDGAGPFLRASRPSWPFVQLANAGTGYQSPRVAGTSTIRVETVHKI